jgi:hypothetical protein
MTESTNTQSSELEQILEELIKFYDSISEHGIDKKQAIAAIEKLMVQERIAERMYNDMFKLSTGEIVHGKLRTDYLHRLKELEPVHTHRFSNVMLMSNPPQKQCLECGEYVNV